MSPQDPRSIERVGPYRVLSLHAEGGQAWIFEVEDPHFGVRRALKALKPQAGPAGEFDRFRAEAQALAELSHPHLVTPFDFGRDEATGWFYYTMTFVEGETLAERLAGGGPLSLEELRAVFIPVLDALVAVHDSGKVHRDIKPSNILVSTRGHAYLTDLGIMMDLAPNSEHTQTGIALGSAYYMSPEQARGRRSDIGPHTDVFALGLVVFEALTGASAYATADIGSGSAPAVLMYLGSRVQSGKELELPMNEVPAPLKAFVEKACSLPKEERYPDAREMRQAFLAALAKAEGRGPTPGHLRFLENLGWRTVALAVVVTLLAGALWLVRGLQDQAAAARSIEQAEGLEAEVAQLLEVIALGDPELDVELRIAERAARFELDAGRAYVADGLPDSARTRAERAILRFQDLCSRLAFGLQKRALGTAEELRERTAPLEAGFLPEELRASQLAPERWTKLQQHIGDLGAKPSTKDACSAAGARWEAIEAASGVQVLAADLETDLDARLPDVARQIRREAVMTRDAARKLGLDHRTARSRLEEGQTALAAGDASRSDGSWFAALRSYAAAKTAFAELPALGPALGVKLLYEEREQEARASGASGLRSAGRVYDHAERLLFEGDFEAASSEYGRAVELLERAVTGAAADEEPDPARTAPTATE